MCTTIHVERILPASNSKSGLDDCFSAIFGPIEKSNVDGEQRQLRIGEWKIVKDRLSWILRVFLGDTSADGTSFYVYGKTVYAESEVKERLGRRLRRRVSFTLLER